MCRYSLSRFLAGFLVVVSWSLSGCFFFRESSGDTAPQSNLHRFREAPRVPLTLTVGDDLRDEVALYVNGSVIGEIGWNPKKVFVRAQTLDDGNVVSEARESLVTFAMNAGAIAENGVVTPNTPVPFTLVVPSPPFSDYLIELLWGDDTNGLDAILEPQSEHSLTLNDVVEQDRSCSSEPCGVSLKVETLLKNNGLTAITAVLVGITLQPEGENGTELPGLEHKIPVKNINVSPGAQQLLTFRFGGPYPRGTTVSRIELIQD